MVVGVYVPYFFIQSYALELSIPESMTFNIVAIMNAAAFFGRFPYNGLADMCVFSYRLPLTSGQCATMNRYGGITILTPCCFAIAIIIFLWRFVHTMSMGYTVAATGALVGSYVGAVRDSKSHNVMER
jgi:hypothetical protein